MRIRALYAADAAFRKMSPAKRKRLLRISLIVDTRFAAWWTPVSPDGGRSVATLGFS